MLGKTETLCLVALPLSRQPRLTCYYAHRIAQKPPSPPSESKSGASASSVAAGPSSPTSTWIRLLNRGTEFGSRQWDALGKAPKGNWKWRIYMAGERAMDRIDFEEWALKSIDPALAPKPLRKLLEKDASKVASPMAPGGKWEKVSDEGLGNRWEHVEVPLIYPSALEKPDELLASFSSALMKREPHHRKWMKLNLYLSPLTMPFALIPLIPNLPFFYMLWRAWSHWRALKASEYLNKLLARGLIATQSSKALNDIYLRQSLPSVSASPDEPGMLVTKDMVPDIVTALNLGDGAAVELNRAVDQAKARLRNFERKTERSAAEQVAAEREGSHR